MIIMGGEEMERENGLVCMEWFCGDSPTLPLQSPFLTCPFNLTSMFTGLPIFSETLDCMAHHYTVKTRV